MIDRIEIKGRAREALRGQRGTCIALVFLPLVFGFFYSLITNIAFPVTMTYGAVFGAPVRLTLRTAVPIQNSILAITIALITAVFYAALAVGIVGVYTRLFRRDQTAVREAFTFAGTNMWRKFGMTCWVGLLTFLWSLLLIIPGIVKTYAYSMAPYLLNEYPSVTARQAVRISNRMTQGYKGDLLVMQLSFLGWMLLSAFTFHILALVFVIPYMSLTLAGFYDGLMDAALRDGRVSPAELGESAFGR